MKPAQITSFFLWSITAFAAVGLFLSLPANKITPIQAVSDIPSAAFSVSDMTALFKPASPTSPLAPIATHSGSLKISGIIFSNNDQQSRVLIPSVGGRPQAFAVGSTLPNGGTLRSIEKRRITYELNGQHHSVDLPRLPVPQ